MVDKDSRSKLLSIFCCLQIGVQEEECLESLCAETIPLKLFDQFDFRKLSKKFLKNPKLAEYAAKLIEKMDELELRRTEIEEEERKAEEEEEKAAKLGKLSVDEVKPEILPVSVLPDSTTSEINEKELSRVAVQTEFSQRSPIKLRINNPRFAPVPVVLPTTLETSDAEFSTSVNVFKVPQPRCIGDEGRKKECEIGKSNASAPRNTVKQKRGRRPADKKAAKGSAGTRRSKNRAKIEKEEEEDEEEVTHDYTNPDNFENFQLLYRRATEEKFPDQVKDKPAEETWIAYFKRLHRASMEVASLSGPATTDSSIQQESSGGFVVADTVRTNKKTEESGEPNANQPSTSGDRIPTFRVNPEYKKNLHKYIS